jgi:hypothetical protein
MFDTEKMQRVFVTIFWQVSLQDEKLIFKLFALYRLITCGVYVLAYL